MPSSSLDYDSKLRDLLLIALTIREKLTTYSDFYSLHWVRAHIGDYCNEIADFFAKLAITYGEKKNFPAPQSHIVMTLKNKLLSDWEVWWSTCNNGIWVQLYIPRPNLSFYTNSSFITRFLNGHGPFISYLNRFNLKSTNLYLCGSVGDADHYVFSCPFTRDFHLKCPVVKAKPIWLRSVCENPYLHSKLISSILTARKINQ
ncbi:RNase H domain-containing protein [Nephila pilipes]|uniref:RNase H domain-containing protein n=1 Tax=Nephila pilipes TaxID=299642 RepID=A0A8X6T9S0_NEPPI|nr:RNase H domain-containing protein [Nephila pilipes]